MLHLCNGLFTLSVIDTDKNELCESVHTTQRQMPTQVSISVSMSLDVGQCERTSRAIPCYSQQPLDVLVVAKMRWLSEKKIGHVQV